MLHGENSLANDELKQIGHACGHNLIATAGVAVALGVKAAMVKYNIPGKVVLLGTPGERYLNRQRRELTVT